MIFLSFSDFYFFFPPSPFAFPFQPLSFSTIPSAQIKNIFQILFYFISIHPYRKKSQKKKKREKKKGKEQTMHLYHLTLQKPTGIILAITGSFSKPKAIEVVVVRGGGKILELLRPDPESARFNSIASVDVFGYIRSIAPFRLPGN